MTKDEKPKMRTAQYPILHPLSSTEGSIDAEEVRDKLKA